MNAECTQQYKRSQERPFLAEERPRTTILFGNLSPKHDAFIEAVFRGCGYHCVGLPLPTKASYQIGKEFCNNGLCNPNYYTTGNLINYLKNLKRLGLSSEEIVDRHIYFTIGGCGPCRFGMYESEYALALENAGFPGFRVLTFNSKRVIRDGSKQPGLNFTWNYGLGMLNALNLGDILFETAYRIRPYEVQPGATDRAMQECVSDLARFLQGRCGYRFFRQEPRGKLHSVVSILAKIRYHLGARDWREALGRVRDRLSEIEVDWLRVKPLVKATGEFYSAISEGDANHNLYRFLESEGAEVLVDPIGNLIRYWIHQSRGHNDRRKGLAPGYWKKELLLAFSEWFWGWQYRRAAKLLGDLALRPEPQDELARRAGPYYHPLTRGGEGHLIVGRGLEMARLRQAHLMVTVKPFGCMPATQSDAVMFMLSAQDPNLLFLPFETLGEGEVHALSRVQMAVGQARHKATAEFDEVLHRTGANLEQIRAYVSRHPEMRRPFYRFRRSGLAGTAAQFVAHTAERMRRHP